MSKALQAANLLGVSYKTKMYETRKKVGVVLPIMGNKRYVLGLIDTIKSVNHDISIIAIDNGSKDGTTDELKKLKDEKIIFYHEIHPEPIGVAAAWNRGMKVSLDNNMDYIMIINTDILLHKDCIDNLVNFYQSSPTLAIVMATDVGWKLGVMHHATAIKPFEQYSKELNDMAWPEVGGAGFSCYLTGPELVRDVGYFDENFVGAYYEDNDIHWRLVEAGYSAQATYDALYIHFESRSIREGGYHNNNFSNNFQYFKNKHNTLTTEVTTSPHWKGPKGIRDKYTGEIYDG